MYGLGAYGTIKLGELLLDWLKPKSPTRTPSRTGGGATDPSVVTPNPKPDPSGETPPPPPSGGDEQSTGGNNITPDQVKENLKNYPNSSGYPWGIKRGGQYIDASGRRQFHASDIAEGQQEYMNNRGLPSAFQSDLDINAQLTDRSSPLFNAIDRMRGGQLSQFRIGAEEANARQAMRVKSMEMESRLRMAEFAKRQAEMDEAIRRRYNAGP